MEIILDLHKNNLLCISLKWIILQTETSHHIPLSFITQPLSLPHHHHCKRKKKKMRATNSHFLLLDLHSSWHSANRIPSSVFAYLQCSHVLSSVSSSFRRTRSSRKGIVSSSSSSSSLPSPSIRRPGDRFSNGNGVLSSNSSSKSDSAIISELDLFLELVPQRMRGELFRHEEIEEMIEVVMDLGRKPLARFPSGDWVISEQPVKVEDLRHAISKVSWIHDPWILSHPFFFSCIPVMNHEIEYFVSIV